MDIIALIVNIITVVLCVSSLGMIVYVTRKANRDKELYVVFATSLYESHNGRWGWTAWRGWLTSIVLWIVMYLIGAYLAIAVTVIASIITYIYSKWVIVNYNDLPVTPE